MSACSPRACACSTRARARTFQAGAVPTDDPPTPPLPVDPSDPSKDIYGNTSYPGLDGVDVWGYLTSETTVSDYAAHPTLVVTSQVYLDHEYKLMLGLGFCRR